MFMPLFHPLGHLPLDDARVDTVAPGLTRRNMLQIGAPLLGLGLADLLRLESQAAEAGLPTSNSKKSLIIFWISGTPFGAPP